MYDSLWTLTEMIDPLFHPPRWQMLHWIFLTVLWCSLGTEQPLKKSGWATGKSLMKISRKLSLSSFHFQSVSHSVMSDSLHSMDCSPTRLLCPWNSPGKNTGVDSYFLLQRLLLFQVHWARFHSCLFHSLSTLPTT